MRGSELQLQPCEYGSAIKATEDYIRRVTLGGSSQPSWHCSSWRLQGALVRLKLKAHLGTHDRKVSI